ncbi:hypothetical protein G6F70_006230 [Rhizopus microsporus]|uniref:Uncharacterized protein n=2 Tax=Rhizopus TaxID=4842 RepID=A0A367JAX4_RHIAZ|nr:hypothetical protein G6F71_007069 [Rhizopus microsporus]RCH87087.1 hypothetical protein CU097_010169 [Rhizopus azygosporus]KAG1197931.1 hypothetical protein G6F70_006230 [Rhizopus microsporus]KAG1208695.1 hypothetical protein G6F69_006996 [Rhizopus microsporus]KAG1227718.1 hypothetical protein G6F67_008276 [Rhizopus microsporus]
MSSRNYNPYSSLDEEIDDEPVRYEEEDDDSLYSYDAEAEWEESKQQIQTLFALVIFPFAGKWLGKKFSFWLWANYLTRSTPLTSRFGLISPTQPSLFSSLGSLINSVNRFC